MYTDKLLQTIISTELRNLMMADGDRMSVFEQMNDTLP